MWCEDKVADLIGKTLVEVINDSGDEIIFKTSDGETYRMNHSQDCCESVRIEDVTGDLKDLVGEPILEAREDHDDGVDRECSDSCTWTFYNIRTRKGGVTIRWKGESNGYYSERVDFCKDTV